MPVWMQNTYQNKENILITHDLVQGSDDWMAFRFEHDGASEAAAQLGLSKKMMRNEMLHIKHTGLPREFSDWVQKYILDHGHVVEALARPIVEEIIGEDLYPVTCSDGRLSASCDGLTLDERIAFEHKQWAAELAASVDRCELPEEHAPQCQQVLMVTGAEKLIFVVSDGTRDNLVYMWVYPDPAWFERIRAGWKQFNEDLANYVPAEVVAPVVASPTLNLPAVSVQVQGSIALISNLDLFGDALRGFISKIPEKPSTDQEFADCKSAIGKLQVAQDALDAAEANALGQIATFDEMRRTKALYFDLARTTRLALEKLVTQREAAIKVEITQGGKDKLSEHVAALNKRLGKPYMPTIVADWAAAIKSKRTVSSLKNAVDTLLSQKMIEASQIADRIEINLNTLRELAKDHAFLFSDTPAIVMKANDDLVALIKSRIADHTAAEAKKAEELRASIQKEEQAKAEKAALEKVNAQLAAEQAERDRIAAIAATEKAAADRIEQERIDQIHQAEEDERRKASDLQRAQEKPSIIDAEFIPPAPAAYPFPTRQDDHIPESVLSRDIYESLGYKRWENFAGLISRAKNMIANGIADGNITEQTREVAIGSGAIRAVDDHLLDWQAYELVKLLASSFKMNGHHISRNETAILGLIQKWCANRGMTAIPQSNINGNFSDLLIDSKISIEFDEPHHEDARQKSRDIEKDFASASSGVKTLRIGLDHNVIDIIAMIENEITVTKMVPAAPIDTGAKIKLGDICNRLGFTVTADFLAARGFPQVGREGAAKLYRACDWQAICASIISHVQGVASEGMKVAA